MDMPFLAAMLLLLLVFVALLALAVWIGKIVVERSVGARHRDLDEIRTDGRVPERWRRAVTPDAQAAERCRYLAQLDKLVGYVRSTTLVEDEAARSEVLSELAQVRSAWETKPFDEL
ncbi:MAG: hypothetical protein GXY52_05100 [Chloroflexi bacterium]|nr:hypothetical protein [Chloroflexota bacterium]